MNTLKIKSVILKKINQIVVISGHNDLFKNLIKKFNYQITYNNMNNKKISIWIPFITLISFLFSCTPDAYFTESKTDIISNEYLVSRQTAEILANNILFTQDVGVSREELSTRTAKKQIESVLEVPDDENQTAYYIINYENGGFLILAGDKRSEPLLAFSDVNKFDLDSEYFPGGLVSWLYNSKETIQSLREENVEIAPQIERQWDNLFQGETDIVLHRTFPPIIIDPDDPIDDPDPLDPNPDCEPYTIRVGPLLQTEWGQRCEYNSMTPAMSCGPCGHAFTGCVATAMAQVMRYHEYPTNYNWSGMPNASGSDEIARLMRDIGIAVDMDYQCNGSGASVPNKVVPGFKNSFGYSSALYADYNYMTVKMN